MVINPKLGNKILKAGPIVRHVHLVCGDSEEAYHTYEIRTHAQEPYISNVYIVSEGEPYLIVRPTDTHKEVKEVYRCRELKVAVVWLYKTANLHNLSLPNNLVRFVSFDDTYESSISMIFDRVHVPKKKFDVRMAHVNNISVKRENDKLVAEIHTIKSTFFGSYEKTRLVYDPKTNEVLEREEEEELLLIE